MSTYIMALNGIECFSDIYILLFEISLCIVMSNQGKYHCRYMKYTAYGLVSSDTFTRIDNEYDLVSYDIAVLLPISLVVLGVATTFLMSLRHFHKVKQLNAEKMNFTEEEQSKLDRLPLVFKLAINSLLDAVRRILDGDCNESAITDTMATLNNNSQGRYADEDLVNYEEAARMLGISETNRMKLRLLLDMNNIQQVVIHNQKVGFKRTEIMALRSKMYDKRKKRRKKL